MAPYRSCTVPTVLKVYDDEIGSGIWFYDSLYADTDDRKRPTRPVNADSIVVKTLRMVLCSSCDGVPLKWKKENDRPGSFKISIDWYHFRPLLVWIINYIQERYADRHIMTFWLTKIVFNTLETVLRTQFRFWICTQNVSSRIRPFCSGFTKTDWKCLPALFWPLKNISGVLNLHFMTPLHHYSLKL